MDPGTIVGIVSLTLQVSRLMYKTAEAIGSAGEDVRLKAIEVDSFTKTVKAVQQALEEPPAIPPSLLRLRAKIEDTIADIIDNYNKALDPLKKLLDIFNPLVVRFAEQRRKLRALGHMIYFSLKRNDVQKYCQALQTSSGSLNLSLSALIALQTRDANGLKGMAIQVQYISGTLEPVLSARPDQHQLEDVPPSFLGSLQSMNTNADSDKVVEEGGDDSKDTQEGKPSSSEVQDNQLTVVSQVSGDLIRYRSREGDEGLSQEEINSIKYQVDGVLNDEGIMPANDVLAVTKSLGRKLQEFAKVANTAPTTTEENLDNQPPQSGFNSARDRSPEPSQVSVDGAQLRGPAQRKNPELLEAIKFRDWEGTVHPLPFEEVLNFEDLKGIITNRIWKDTTSYNDKNRDLAATRLRAFDAGHADLIGPTGHIIPAFWEQLVQPGWEIALLFRGDFEYLNKTDQPENPRKQEDKAPTKFSFFKWR